MNHTDQPVNRLATSATLHCLAGCSIGEILGLAIGAALLLSDAATIFLAVGLAFVFGYLFTMLPLLKGGLSVKKAIGIALAADTLSILVMEIVDNAVLLVIPGALDASLDTALFWVSLAVALGIAFVAAWPLNRYLLLRGKGHSLVHQYHSGKHHDV